MRVAGLAVGRGTGQRRRVRRRPGRCRAPPRTARSRRPAPRAAGGTPTAACARAPTSGRACRPWRRATPGGGWPGDENVGGTGRRGGSVIATGGRARTRRRGRAGVPGPVVASDARTGRRGRRAGGHGAGRCRDARRRPPRPGGPRPADGAGVGPAAGPGVAVGVRRRACRPAAGPPPAPRSSGAAAVPGRRRVGDRAQRLARGRPARRRRARRCRRRAPVSPRRCPDRAPGPAPSRRGSSPSAPGLFRRADETVLELTGVAPAHGQLGDVRRRCPGARRSRSPRGAAR